MTRRRVLKTAAAAGAGAALVWGLGTDHGVPADRTDIVYAMARSEPGEPRLQARTRDVLAEWHENVQRAFDLQEELLAADLSSLLGSFVVPGSYDDPEASLAVDATDQSVQEPLGELLGDLAFDVSIVEEIPPDPGEEPTVEESYQVSGLDRERVPSGVVCQAPVLLGTVAPALFDANDQSRYFTTSNHVYGDGGRKETEHEGEPLSLLRDEETRRIGSVVRGYPSADVVRVAPVDGYRPTPEIARASPGTVIGQYTKVGLADLTARGEELRKVGAFSNRSTGRIKGVDGATCYVGGVCKRGQLKWGGQETMVDGDSGSVNFREDPENPEEYVLVGGVNSARTWWPGANFTWGTAAHHLLDEYGLHF